MEAVYVMRDLNLPIEIFKENILGLQMCGEDVQFAELPVGCKTSLTKMYNTHMQSSIQMTRKKKTPTTDKNLFSGATFDPSFMEEPDDSDESSEDDGPEQDVVATNSKGKKAPAAAKGKQSRAAPARGGGAGRGGRGGGRGASKGGRK